jgi:hypothetical protein
MQQRRPGNARLFFCLAAALLAWLAACSPPLDWREVRAADGGFVVALPGKPQTVTRNVTIDAQTVEMTMVSAGVGATVFAVGVARLPAPLRDSADARAATLAHFRDALARNINGEVVARHATHVRRGAGASATAPGASEPVPAEQIVVRGHAGTERRAAQLVARLALVEDRFYQVVALGAEGAVPAAAIETFFTSFRIASP